MSNKLLSPLQKSLIRAREKQSAPKAKPKATPKPKAEAKPKAAPKPKAASTPKATAKKKEE